MRRATVSLVVVAMLALSAAPAPAQIRALRREQDDKTLDAQVEVAIRRAMKYLWSTQQGDGGWVAQGKYGVGKTALVAYSLLASDVNPQDPRMLKALDFLATNETKKTYSLGLRCYVWHLANRNTLGKYRDLLKKDAKVLIEWGLVNGRYAYTGPGGDNSNSQYGLLGVWAAAADGLEIPSQYWEKVLRHWKGSQGGSGGWDYRGPGNKPTMTAAGVASLYVCYDYSGLADANPGKAFQPIEKGLGWFDKNFKPAGSGYYFYGLERVGLASGYKFFGKHDWYQEIAQRLIKSQKGGAWRDPINTAFGLLFLIRGRRPVLFNKLQHGGDWDRRSRDLAAVTRWVGYNFETEVNWQIIDTDHPVREWEDASILYITGTTDPKFTEDDYRKIAQFVRRGGMIFTVVQQGGSAFSQRMKYAYTKMFPDDALTPVGKAHLLNNIYFQIKKPARMSEVHNGVRPLVVHCEEDLAREWQSSRVVTAKEVREYEIAFNVVMYGVDTMRTLPPRGAINWPTDRIENEDAPTLTIARVKHSGRWNPEPLAHKRFTGMMARYAATKVQYAGPVLAADLPDCGTKIAHMTGAGSVTFSPADVEGIRKFVAAGGTLIIDAAGGNQQFADTVESMLSEAFGGGGYALSRLPGTSPIFMRDKMEIESCGFRRLTAMGLASNEPQLWGVLIGDRPGVIYSALDLTAGMAGVRSGAVRGYDHHSAFDLMRNIVLYAASVNAAPEELLLKGPSAKPQDAATAVPGEEF